MTTLFYRCLSALLILCLFFDTPAQSYPLHRAKLIQGIEFSGIPSVDEVLLKEVTHLEVGQPFNEEKLEYAKQNLRKWGIFKTVEAEIRTTPKGVMIQFKLEAGSTIRDVVIRGNYPFLETKIKRAVILHSGDLYYPEKVPEQIDRLLQFYEKQGYFNSTVFIEEEYFEKTGKVDIKIRIQKGITYRLSDIEIEGPKELNHKRFRNILFTYVRYKPEQLKKDLEKIKVKLAHDGYVRARVKLLDVQFNHETKKVAVKIGIYPGKKVYIAWKGNEKLKNFQLKKALTLDEDEDYDEYALTHTQSKLISLYKGFGFTQPTIEYRKENLSDNEVLVTFVIQEGPQEIIKQIDFTGNQAVSDKTLRKQMITQEEGILAKKYFIEPVFNQDLISVENFLKNNGYLEAKINEWRKEWNRYKDKVLLTVDLSEGTLNLVEKISFETESEAPSESVKKQLLTQSGQYFSYLKLESDVRSLLIDYSNRGYPYAQAKTELHAISPQKWEVVFKIEPGFKVNIGKILFVGNIKTRNSLIQKNLYLKEGEVFSAEKLEDSQNALRRLNIFNAVSIQTLGLTDQQAKVHLVVRMEEKKTQQIDFGLGYDTDTGFTSKLIYQKNNLFGIAKNLRFAAIGGEQLQKGELTYIDPRLFGTGLQFVSGIFAQREDRPSFEDTKFGGSLALLYDLTHSLTAFTQLRFENINFNESETDLALLGDSARDRNLLSLEIGSTFDRRDNFGDPHKGYYLSAITKLTNDFNQVGLGFVKLTTQAGVWYSPFSRLTIANALRLSYLHQFSSESIPANELLYLGGDDTLRGFGRDAVNPAGGKLSLVHNLELQFRLVNKFQLVGFLDSGTLTNNFDEISSQSFRHSAGIGFRYVTPIGPIRLDYGFILDKNPGESPRRLHFTFGYFF